MTDKPLFSILIPTWNNLDFLRLCVDSIRKNSAYPHEIIIHVNDGSDGTLDWVRAQGLKYRHSKENIGICWSMNGLRPLMSTEYLVYINDDQYMLPGWDEALYSEIQRIGHKLFFLASTMIQPRAIRRRPNSIPVADYGTSVQSFREADLLRDFRRYEVPDWKGAEMPPSVVHRDMWDLCGGYSVEYSPGMASDPDFLAKMWLAGVRTFKGVGRSLCYHFMSRSVGRVVKNDGPTQFLRKFGITIRAFREQMLHIEEPWDDELQLNPATLRPELMRSSAKRALTIFRRADTARLWDPLPSSNPSDILNNR